MPPRRQGGWARANSHLVTFRHELTYRVDDERLVIAAGTQLVGALVDGPEPALRLETMTLALSPSSVEIAPNPNSRLTLSALAQQTAQAAAKAQAAGDFRLAVERYLQAATQQRLLGDLDQAEAMQGAAQRAHNAALRTPEGRADFDRYTGELSDEALRQLGATIHMAVRQLGGYQYAPASPDEAVALWDIVRYALAQVASLDRWNREHPRPVQPITPETLWVNAENLAGELLTEVEGPPERRAVIAELALALDPDEADGYTLLGGLAHARGDRGAARRWYEEGVRAGERKLGAAFFSDPDRPRFWLAVETRPYMHARASLAHALYELGEVEQAIAEYWGLLELNPGDNQGLRYILASLLLERRDHVGFARLYQLIATPLEGEEGDEDDAADQIRAPLNPLDPANHSTYESAYWLYPLALYHFQRAGDDERAQAALRLARSQNHHVIPLLMGRTVMPRESPDSYSPGSFDEAVLYARTGRKAWATTPGAIEWLRGKPATKPAPPPKLTKQSPVKKPPATKGDASLRELLGEWVLDDTTYQTAQTKKAYRTTIARLLDWLEHQGLPLVGASLTPEQVNAFLDGPEAARRGPARNRIRVWCEWLERRRVIAQNPLPLGGE